ncbi:hypothetical protein Q5P01_019961 [Channa striata]|uniref:Synaptotagmin-like protein 2 n=1 Tax=Channa striata TaxID=64152 RepID=A0AA88S7T9_CHASR|nr:hypothetical protein Q5P01_019961 [Channa striata]
MIDLSFLSEEEQETILAVLKRDAELKKTEEQRIQNLQKSARDRSRLRYLTGEWFYEAKQLRHQDRIHGCDIIRASMRNTHKPLTILEISHILPEKSSFFTSKSKDVFVPPVLRGLLQEPRTQPTSKRYQNQNPDETPQDASKIASQSPVKRKNPFNSELIASHTVEEKDTEAADGAVSHTQTLHKEPLPSSDSCRSYASNLREECNDNWANLNPSAASSSSQYCSVELDWSGGRQTDADIPRGILKNVPNSSFTDSVLSQSELHSLSSLDSPTETWVDRKQVRFRSTIGPSRAELQDGKELGEHSLLDTDSTALSETDSIQRSLHVHTQTDSQEGELKNKQEVGRQQASGVSSLICAEESGKLVHLETKPEEEHCCQAKDTHGPNGHSVYEEKLPEQSTNNSYQTTSDTQPSTSGSSSSPHADPTQTRQRPLLIFSTEVDRSADEQSPQKEGIKIPNLTETDQSQDLDQGAANTTVDTSACVKHETKLSRMTDVKTVQLTALQNTTFKETVDTVHADTQQDATEGRVVQLPEKLSNLRSFWERENTGPKIIFTKGEGRQEDTAKAETEALHVHQTYVESKHDFCMKLTKNEVQDIGYKSQEKTLPLQTEGRLSEDGTYRANPVLIYEETEDYLTVSVKETQIPGPHENIIPSLTYTAEFKTHSQVGDIEVSLPRQSMSNTQKDKPAKISELKHFWEKEYTGPRVIVARVKEVSHCSVLDNKDVSPQSDLGESNREEQTSPNRTKSSGTLKPLRVTDKGFVGLNSDRLQLRSRGSTGDIPAAWSQPHVKAETESEERPLSPSQPYRPAATDPKDKIRRSPSKTCHPKVLPKECSSPKRSSLEGSPLKTFPIDIGPQTKVVGQQQVKPTALLKQRKSPSHEAKQTNTQPITEIPSRPLPLHAENPGTYTDHVNTPQNNKSSSTFSQSKKALEHGLESFTHLTRSFLPQDSQYYLGPKEKAHSPPFNHEEASATENDAIHKPQSALRDFVGNQIESENEWSTATACSGAVDSKHRNPGQDTTTRAWTLSRARADSYDDSSNSILSALKRLSSRSMSSSKSLENLTSQTRDERSKTESSDRLNFSMDDVSSHLPSASALSSSNQMKTSLSVPVLQQNETECDSTSGNNLGWRRETGSSMSNISLSSGMVSMSSVSGSIGSINPADCGDIEIQGSIQFAVNYIQKLGEFHIFVVHCRDLAVADTKKNRSDPYVKCYLLPDKSKLGKRKTTVKKKTLNPTYNEILKFTIKMEELKTHNLNISVWHNDTFGRNSFLGEVDLDLSEWDFSNAQINEYTLKTRVLTQTSTSSPSRLMDSGGKMRVALRFLPQMSHSNSTSRMEPGELQIWVKDCKNLPSVRGVMIDPFVKCTVLPDTSRNSRQKTRVVKRTANPMFNHTMVYDGFRPEDLREACVELTVWDHDRLNNHYIGGLRLGLGTGKSYGTEVVWMDSTTEEANLWQRMLRSDGEWVEDVLPLRMLVMAKSMSK